MKKFLFFNIIIILYIFYFKTPVCAELSNINAESYILIDSKNGQVLCEKNPNLKLYPASTTKIMTAIISLEKGNLNQLMTASESAVNAIGPGGMNIGIMSGEELTLEDLLNALLVRSANETSYIIAENISNSIDSFISEMNNKAAILGAKDTHFVNPCGMDTEPKDKEHLSTVNDLAIISKYAMNIPKFREIVSKQTCSIGPTNKHKDSILLPTTNKLFQPKYKSEYYTKITGIKTGYTDKAGYNLVASAVNSGGLELISVIFGVKNQSSEKVFSYSKELLEYGFKNFKLSKLVAAKQVFKEVSVIDAKDKTKLKLVAADDFLFVLPIADQHITISFNEHLNTAIKAPIKANDVLGYVEVLENNKVIGNVNLVAVSDVEKKPSIVENVKKNVAKDNSNTILIIFFVFLFFRLIFKFLSRKLKLKKFEK